MYNLGTVAQLVERLVRIQEARGSTPLCSIFFIEQTLNEVMKFTLFYVNNKFLDS
jgi:hypothetical protein